MKYWELLVSPIEHQQLILGSDRSELINTASGKRYPVIDEIPAGVYFLRIEDSPGYQSEKVIIVR